MIDSAVARRIVELRELDADAVVVAEADDGSAILRVIPPDDSPAFLLLCDAINLAPQATH